MISRAQHDAMANAIRALSMDAVQAANSGHPGLPMGAADIATVLFREHLKYDPADTRWADRDRFILSAGHGSMLIYALLHLIGVKGVSMEDIKAFRQLGSRTPGHPEFGHTEGVETTTGPLGQGIAMAAGFALGEALLAQRFSRKLVNHHTYVLASDGDLMEGISQEAITLAGHLKLAKLIVLWDDNDVSIDGPLAVADSTDQIRRFESAGWAAERIDGHAPQAIHAAIERAKKSARPSLIACKTTIGYGSPNKAGKSAAHGSPLGPDEIRLTKERLGWNHGAFEIPQEVYDLWSVVGRRGAAARAEWARQLDAKPKLKANFAAAMRGELPKAYAKAIKAFKAAAAARPQDVATRRASEMTLEAISPTLPGLISGSADLTSSNNTRTGDMGAVTPGNFSGRFVHYGIREHAMAAAMNGMALHGGLIPASGTFLVFSDYCRPAIRLSALMKQRVIYVMTHDSIGVGEDGPTHQPVEQIAALRAIPNLDVFRPCDVTETAESWEAALTNASGPSILALTRQNLPQLRKDAGGKNLAARGAYELLGADGKADVTIFASGSEVSLAVKARAQLLESSILARVVSVPSIDRFLRQDEAYRKKVIGRARVRIGVEAGIRQSWDALIGSEGTFIGMECFGASGPASQVYAHFGITAAAIAAAAKARLGR